jgi:preprotein translocase subunit SecE
MIKKYLKESLAELNNVTWPTRKQGIRITTIVFIFMIASAAVLGFVDYLFSLGIRGLLSL